MDEENNDKWIDEEDIRNYSLSFRKYLNIQGRWPRWSNDLPI